jgi:hypothetical protein
MVTEQRASCLGVRRVMVRTPVLSHGLGMSPLWQARSACFSSRAAVQPVPAADRPTAALPLSAVR